MLKSEDLRFFLVLSRSASLAAAARQLNISPSAVTQRLQSLERQLGLRLTHRNGRSMILTDEGEILAEHGRQIIGRIDTLQEALAVRRATVSGALRILAPFGFGRRYVTPACASFIANHPDVTIDLQLTDRLGRHPEQAWDVAIHIGTLHDSALMVRRLAPNRRLLCAAPSYLDVHGTPKTPADLQTHDCIALRENEEDGTLWRLSTGLETQAIRIAPKLTSNDGTIVRDWALRGLGIVVRSEWDIAEDVAEGRLVHLMPAWALPAADIVALTGSGSAATRRTAGFIEHLEFMLAQPKI